MPQISTNALSAGVVKLTEETALAALTVAVQILAAVTLKSALVVLALA